MNNIIAEKNKKRYLPHDVNTRNLSLKVNSSFILNLEFSCGIKFYLSSI